MQQIPSALLDQETLDKESRRSEAKRVLLVAEFDMPAVDLKVVDDTVAGSALTVRVV